MTGRELQYHATLDMLKHIDAPVKLVIAGNHDLTLDRHFVPSHGHDPRIRAGTDSQWIAARDLWTAPGGRARRESVTFLDEGERTITLANGARVNIYASPYTPEFMDWGFPYHRSEDRFNPADASFSDARNIAQAPVRSFSVSPGSPIDIMITHGPPWGRLDQVPQRDGTVLNTGCSHLLRAVMRARPLIHCFGHIHEGHGAEMVEWSEVAEELLRSKVERGQWERATEPAWEAGIKFQQDDIARIEPDLEAAMADRAIIADVSSDSDRPLERGRHTLFVNAAIMDVRYRPVNAPWLIEVDLPTA
ncbi:hypothetical protein DL766_000970 [Monosporascus sp. MC13-8B]|uniref:Calcineurin-like phosphoesterase domain-containing protein n=1 Tax=Monosporascus cannonballus TaxID=155416 RepID=A0ABY0HAG2_9PEZI|nr:hypothetical protein DL762_003521 [Monosporascus cannonballus]RYP38392.1 hypothetical protein DL766_000970 [Monosporascus sp. MC13-8B]